MSPPSKITDYDLIAAETSDPLHNDATPSPSPFSGVSPAPAPPTPAPTPTSASASASARDQQRPRTGTSAAEIETLAHPGSVRINVKGAFIVEDDTSAASPTAGAGNGNGIGTGRSSPNHHETKDIRLPNHTAVVSHIAIDIGGSLAKLVYFSREAHSTEPGGRLNFLSFETDSIQDCIAFMRHLKEKQQIFNGSKPGELCVMATGGGAYKYYGMIRDALGVDVLREDEMECLIIGLDFFITEIPGEVFTYSEADPMHFVSPSDNIYPYLLVNIGSGVSFLKVSGPRKFERVGGTSLGGGTLWGLLSLLTGARTFDEMLDMASRGDNSRVDMLVGDIYGTDYGKIGLKSTTIASSFGKVFRMTRELGGDGDGVQGEGEGEGEDELRNGGQAINSNSSRNTNQGDVRQKAEDEKTAPFSRADVSRSLLFAISNNIGQIAFLQSQIHGLSHIYFGGSFIRGHPQTMNTLSYGLKFWSQGSKQAYFLRHEGYLGAVGAFLKRQPANWGRRGSFEEALELRMRARANRADDGGLGDDFAVA